MCFLWRTIILQFCESYLKHIIKQLRQKWPANQRRKPRQHCTWEAIVVIFHYITHVHKISTIMTTYARAKSMVCPPGVNISIASDTSRNNSLKSVQSLITRMGHCFTHRCLVWSLNTVYYFIFPWCRCCQYKRWFSLDLFIQCILCEIKGWGKLLSRINQWIMNQR